MSACSQPHSPSHGLKPLESPGIMADGFPHAATWAVRGPNATSARSARTRNRRFPAGRKTPGSELFQAFSLGPTPQPTPLSLQPQNQ